MANSSKRYSGLSKYFERHLRLNRSRIRSKNSPGKTSKSPKRNQSMLRSLQQNEIAKITTRIDTLKPTSPMRSRLQKTMAPQSIHRLLATRSQLSERHYALKSRKGSGNFNNDNLFVVENINGFSLFGICNGHGEQGLEVSTYVSRRFPVILTKKLMYNSDVHKVFESCTRTVNSEVLNMNVNTMVSGTTLIAVLVGETHIYCANVGDSGAFVSTDDSQVIPLSREHKLDNPEEAHRIREAGGDIRPEEGSSTPLKAWIKHQDLPGIHVSRSIGDKVASCVGVVPDPEVIRHERTLNEVLLVIGTSCLFQFLSYEEIARIAIPKVEKRNCKAMACKIVNTARDLSMQAKQIDDISAICVLVRTKRDII